MNDCPEPEILAASQFGPHEIVVDEGILFWKSDHRVWQMPWFGGTPSSVTAEQVSGNFALDEERVYWTSSVPGEYIGSLMSALK